MAKAEEVIKSRLEENRTTLRMSSIPLRIKKEFSEFAKVEFCDNYGLTLKFLWDFYKEQSGKYAQIMEILSGFDARISRLESKPSAKKEIKMLDGSVKNIGGKDEMQE